MRTEYHARQVFDLIAAGNFHVLTDNVRPYVDHDHPFAGLGIIRERVENLLQLQLDNSDAWTAPAGRAPSLIFEGPCSRSASAVARPPEARPGLANCPQCRNQRMPVWTMTMSLASAAAVTSSSRFEPPAWAM